MQIIIICALYLACVKKVAYIYAEVSLKPYYITTCAMHYLFVKRAMRNYNFRHIIKCKRKERILYLSLGWISEKFS